MTRLFKTYWPLIPPLLVFSYLAYHLNFVQDDAYISYRYVANFLDGHGLVFNIGERVEGFTNFGWVIFMILWGALGFDYILISQIAGFLFGAGIVVLSYKIALQVFEKEKLPAILAVLLVGFNLSLAYWSPAGLETAAFSFFAMWSFYALMKNSRWLVFSVLMAVWIRPDGAVVAAVIMIAEAIVYKRFPRFSFSCIAVAFVLSLPFVVFKIIYFGSIFPNPFFAKTGFNIEQIQSGLEYTGRYLSHYGFYGVGLLVPLLLYKRLCAKARLIWLVTVLYFGYVLLIGGDVLKVHRFFLPVLGTMSILSSLSLWKALSRSAHKTRQSFFVLIGAAMIVLTVYLPIDFVMYYNNYERKFVNKMQVKAHKMLAADSSNFSVALPTIGVFGYELLGHNIIDMVGLTDTTIARHSEPPVKGMETTWKETKHNSKYLLSSSPDYIIFSTDMKPSAPAERALMLFPQFLECYRTIGWFYQSDTTKEFGVLIVAFKRVKEITGELVPTYPVEWVENYKLGLDEYTRGNYRLSNKYLERAIKVSPKPYYPYPIYQMAYNHMQLGNHDRAVKLHELVLEMDSTIFESHKDLYIYMRYNQKFERAELHKRWLQKLVPWYWPRLQAKVEQQIREAGRAGR